MKKVLLINDMPGVGKVALAGMIPIISTMDVEVSNLPTAVISNNFGYGKAEIYDLTQYMRNTQKIWEELKFEFDIITTGILLNEEQVDIVEDIINMHENKPLVIVDPIMGDNGSIYPGLPEGIVGAMRKIVPFADILMPNATEASLILGKEYPSGKFEIEEVENWLNELINIGCKEAIITSVNTKEGHFVYGYSEKDKIFRVPYTHYPVAFGGTGDMFSSLVTGKLGEGLSIKEACEYAVKILNKILKEESKRGLDVIIDVPIEKYLVGLDHLLG